MTVAAQVAPQLMPTPCVVETTLPELAGPAIDTCTRYVVTLKFAVGLMLPAAGIVTTQVADVEQPVALLQDANVEPVPAVAVSVTCVLGAIDAEQLVPQLRLPPPAHDAATVPVPPLPPFEIVRLPFFSVNVAVTVVAVVIDDNEHVPVAFVQAPDQPAKL